MTLHHNVVSQRFFGECFSSQILAIILVISSVAHDTFATQRNAKLLQNSAQRHRHIGPQIHEQLMLAAHDDNVLVRVMFVLALSLDLCFYVVRCCFCFILAEISRESGKAVHWTWSTLNLKGINPIANINFIDLKIFSSAFMIISFFRCSLSLLGWSRSIEAPVNCDRSRYKFGEGKIFSTFMNYAMSNQQYLCALRGRLFTHFCAANKSKLCRGSDREGGEDWLVDFIYWVMEMSVFRRKKNKQHYWAA